MPFAKDLLEHKQQRRRPASPWLFDCIDLQQQATMQGFLNHRSDDYKKSIAQ
jgi:hypothetical protein